MFGIQQRQVVWIDKPTSRAYFRSSLGCLLISSRAVLVSDDGAASMRTKLRRMFGALFDDDKTASGQSGETKTPSECRRKSAIYLVGEATGEARA